MESAGKLEKCPFPYQKKRIVNKALRFPRRLLGDEISPSYHSWTKIKYYNLIILKFFINESTQYYVADFQNAQKYSISEDKM